MSATPVLEALEANGTIASHLHPDPSFDPADHPMPTGREEVWRFTPLKRLKTLLDGEGTGARLTVSGDLPEQVVAREIDLEQAKELGAVAPSDRIAALAVANAPSVWHLDLPREVELDDTVVLDLTGSGETVHSHVLITVGQFAKGSLVLRHRGTGSYAASVTVLVGDGANLNLVSIQDWDDDAAHGGQTNIRVGRDASVQTVTVSLGGDIVRLLENVAYDGPGGKIDQYGLYFVDAGQHIEHRIFVDHNEPHTQSNVDYRGALQGEGAHSVWIGDVLIRKAATGINTYESNRNLVLTDGCRADSVPNLEIETGEIDGAGHSSTTGRFDDEQLFYLRSRGIDENEARRLVVHGFFADILRRIDDPEIVAGLTNALEDELSATIGPSTTIPDDIQES
ncbi:Fe-S cluster assembly protein SufD [Enemella sp. A6]|uniref:Fe-S cluster assembly protein SufD n=1 Tax=Enemella sp. A6 TaxID=3440152 RepID=UPI003EBD2EE1